MRKIAKIDAERPTYFSLWSCLTYEEQAVLRIRFKFKPPEERLPPMESQEEIQHIMSQNSEVAR